MNDCIERERAIHEFKTIGNIFVYGREVCNAIISTLDSIPAADVRPVVRGKWTRIDYEPLGHDYKCSACVWKNDMRTHFCPNCGADMRSQPPKEG